MIEMIFIKFCAIHRSPEKRGNDTEFHPGGLPANKAVHSGQWESSVVMRGLDFTSCLSLAVDPANGTFDLHPLCQVENRVLLIVPQRKKRRFGRVCVFA